MNRPLPLYLAAVAGLLFSAAAPADERAPSPRPNATQVHGLAPPSRALAPGVAALEAVLASSLETDPPGAEVTPMPKPDEWKGAREVRLAHDVEACHAFRVREWLKIHCGGFPAAGASMLAGSREGVALWVDPSGEGNEAMKTARTVDVIFPVRRGDGRIFQITQFGEGWDGPVAWNLAYSVSEQWVAGEPAPIITVR
jgi:hypothetical protein